MRSVLPFAVLVVALGACSLIPLQGCPTALLQGRLVSDGNGGAAVASDFGTQAVRWPDGYQVDDGAQVVLRGPLGNVVASEGETVYVGGGMDANDEEFVACGNVSRDPP